MPKHSEPSRKKTTSSNGASVNEKQQDQTSGLKDNRSSASAQVNLSNIANESKDAQHLSSLQTMTDKFSEKQTAELTSDVSETETFEGFGDVSLQSKGVEAAKFPRPENDAKDPKSSLKVDKIILNKTSFWQKQEKSSVGFTKEELDSINKLSADKKGIETLRTKGFFTTEDARKFIARGDYSTWSKLNPQQRLLVGEYALKWGDPEALNPGVTLHYSLKKKKAELENNTTAAEEAAKTGDARSQAIWEDTLQKPSLGQKFVAMKELQAGPVGGTTLAKLNKGNVAEKLDKHAEILQRIFIILQSSKITVLSKSGEPDVGFKDFQTPVSKLFSHGGRTIITLPKISADNPDKHAISDWIGLTDKGKTNKEAGVYDRKFATHNARVEEGEKPVEERTKEYLGKGMTGAVGANSKNFWDSATKEGGNKNMGLDVAAGGAGNLDFNGNVSLPDGGHGHLYIQYVSPTSKKEGLLMFGMETTAPHSKVSALGQTHDARSNDKTKSPVSMFAGQKADGAGKEAAGRIVDTSKDQKGEAKKGSLLVSLKELEVKLNTQYTEEQKVKLLAGPQQK